MNSVSLVDGHIDEPRVTDEDVVKALEIHLDDDKTCDECLFDMLCTYDAFALKKMALDSLKRLMTENKKLKTEVDILIRKNNTLKDDNDELNLIIHHCEEENEALRKCIV